jgi:hypothetical protein
MAIVMLNLFSFALRLWLFVTSDPGLILVGGNSSFSHRFVAGGHGKVAGRRPPVGDSIFPSQS